MLCLCLQILFCVLFILWKIHISLSLTFPTLLFHILFVHPCWILSKWFSYKVPQNVKLFPAFQLYLFIVCLISLFICNLLFQYIFIFCFRHIKMCWFLFHNSMFPLMEVLPLLCFFLCDHYFGGVFTFSLYSVSRILSIKVLRKYLPCMCIPFISPLK